MGKPRVNDTGLPERVYLHYGSYRYVPLHGKAVNLGRNRVAALKQHELIMAAQGAAVVRPGAPLGRYIDRYIVEVYPRLAEATRRTRRLHFAKLRAYFGAMYPDDVTTVDVYAYKDLRRSAPGQCNGELGTLSALFTKMIEWGGATKNPCLRLVKWQQYSRKRVPTVEQLSDFVACSANPLVPLYVQMKLSWGLRKKDILDLPRIPVNATEHFIEVSKSKRWREREGKRMGEERRLVVTPFMRALLAQIYALPGRPNICQHLFSPSRGKNRGKRYTENGFDSILQGVMKKYVAAGGLAFHEHDIRASSATLDPVGAKKRLGHKHQATTDKYIRQLEVEEIVPLEVALTTKVKTT